VRRRSRNAHPAEIILGIGGVRAEGARAEPGRFHLNEGHAGFVVLQRIRDLIEHGASFDDALAEIRSTTVFTTHPGAGRARRVPVQHGRKTPGQLLGNARRQSGTFSRSGSATTAAASGST
jgi:starch phosphorylase